MLRRANPSEDNPSKEMGKLYEQQGCAPNRAHMKWLRSMSWRPCDASQQVERAYIRDSPDEPRADQNGSDFLDCPEARMRGLLASVALGRRERLMLALRSQFHDEPRNLPEHLPWDSHLGHPQRDIAAVAHGLGAARHHLTTVMPPEDYRRCCRCLKKMSLAKSARIGLVDCTQ